MLGIEGQCIVEINGDEIESDEFNDLAIYDSSGLNLPELQIIINTKDTNKVRIYSEVGKILKVGIGKKEIQETYEFIVFKKVASQGAEGGDDWTLHLWAILNHPDYFDKQRFKTFKSTIDLKRSDEVWSEVMSEYGFTIKTSKSDDRMLWLQYGLTDRRFLDTITWRGYFSQDDPCLSAITRNNDAIFKPLSKLKNVKGTIGDQSGVDYTSNYLEVTQSEGFLSAWGGGTRITPIRNLEEGSDDEVKCVISTQILGEGLRSDARKISEYSYMNDNVHKNWNKAYEQNRILKSSLNALSLEFHFNEYQALYPLDYVKVRWTNIDQNIVMPITGEWLVIDQYLYMTRQTFQQKVKVSREVML